MNTIRERNFSIDTGYIVGSGYICGIKKLIALGWKKKHCKEWNIIKAHNLFQSRYESKKNISPISREVFFFFASLCERMQSKYVLFMNPCNCIRLFSFSWVRTKPRQKKPTSHREYFYIFYKFHFEWDRKTYIIFRLIFVDFFSRHFCTPRQIALLPHRIAASHCHRVFKQEIST